MGEHRWSAEDVLPGHPDRLCDAVAENIVERACWFDTEALVGVEVALHRNMLLVTGRIAASEALYSGWDINPDLLELDTLVKKSFEDAGYIGRWAHQVSIVTDLDLSGLEDDERAIRRYSDDQTIAVGYSDPHPLNGMPIETILARRLRENLAGLQRANSGLLGPDGKILVTLAGQPIKPRVVAVNVSIQHAPGLGYGDLYEIVLPGVLTTLTGLAAHLDVDLAGDWLRINGIGDFTCGGPLGDNGLSGKKLVVDHYGPNVPIGGGAICGKDVHKPDRVGALRARQIAQRLAQTVNDTARVTLGYLPGLENPDRLDAVLGDGRRLDESLIASLIALPDNSLAGTVKDLELWRTPWADVMREGYFGNPERKWET